LVWVDARGLDAEHIARSALEVLRGLGLSNVHVGIGRVAVVAEIRAVSKLGTGNCRCLLLAAAGSLPTAAGCSCSLHAAANTALSAPSCSPELPSHQSPVPSPESLGSLPVSILEPDPALAVLLDGIGVETCGELAALAGESVEVRLGADGVRLWKLARGDDDRLIFAPIPRALPHASLEWSDYALTDTERLLFSVNALLGTVCEKLLDRGSLAREMTLELKLASGNALTHAMRAGRATASRKTWLRLARTSLERMVLPAGVVGLTLYAAAIVTDEGHQGDLFDRGFATAAATEAALASLAEEQGDVVVVPENTAHPLVERRTKWVGNRELGTGNGATKKRKGRARVPKPQLAADSRQPTEQVVSGEELAASVPIRPPSAGTRPFPVPTLSIDSHRPPSAGRLTLYLLPTPRAIEVRTETRRDHVVPTEYRDGGATYEILSVAGPDRVSGERWGEGYAREYFRCIVDDGGMVWLYRDARADGWYLHGWWD
jgi:nucleotidyltransferase/DNA polymerase involved in DNA repair